MDNRLVALLLFLRELGVRPRIDTVVDRKGVQKAVYLGQLSGIDLGYRYSWYLKGPYSPALTRDYFALAEALEAGDATADSYELKPTLKAALGRVRPAFQVPNDVQLREADWYELLASLHYLNQISGYEPAKIEMTIQQQKPHLLRYVSRGLDVLRAHQLL